MKAPFAWVCIFFFFCGVCSVDIESEIGESRIKICATKTQKGPQPPDEKEGCERAFGLKLDKVIGTKWENVFFFCKTF